MTLVIRLLPIGGQGLVCVPLREPTILARWNLDLAFLVSIKLPDFASKLPQRVDSNPP